MGRGECKALLSANISELRENKDGENSESCAVKSFPEVRVWEGGQGETKKVSQLRRVKLSSVFPFLSLSLVPSPFPFSSPEPNPSAVVLMSN